MKRLPYSVVLVFVAVFSLTACSFEKKKESRESMATPAGTAIAPVMPSAPPVVAPSPVAPPVVAAPPAIPAPVSVYPTPSNPAPSLTQAATQPASTMPTTQP